jgi:hypothetical protein
MVMKILLLEHDPCRAWAHIFSGGRAISGSVQVASPRSHHRLASTFKETAMPRPFHRALRAFALLLAALASTPSHASSPLSLVVTYHASPPNRLALRQELEGAGVRRFQHWKDEGVISDSELLFGRYADSGSADSVLLLTFPDAAALERWKQVERSYPAGLDATALALTTSIDTAPADLARSRRGAPASADSVFVVIPYETMIAAPAYLEYADGYVLPQFDGWIREGVLASYAIYVGRYGAGRPWSTMVVLEYKNEAALGARDEVVAKVRARLMADPAWKAINDAKKTIRKELRLVIADRLTAR